ncbi:MAG TPA: DNA-3-methyladenine glycosylase [Candidatus Saccharimonadales bacterium]|jgi:DNA-3-methyladenine glycosylase|nr:DNA-3-methyladenine glycosylase [Candidatus Saccharimonadales bacterium]
MSSEQTDIKEFLEGPVDVVAPGLIGYRLRYKTPDGDILEGRIVEVEAYRQDDPASHSFGGNKGRAGVMFGSAGTVYVYFTYGMYHCLNIVCGPVGHGAAVLIRAVEPTQGVEQMWRNRYGEAAPPNPPAKQLHNLTNGPAKWVLAFGLGKAHNGHDLFAKNADLQILSPLRLPKNLVQTVRVGISKATDIPWRWYDGDSQFISKR